MAHAAFPDRRPACQALSGRSCGPRRRGPHLCLCRPAGACGRRPAGVEGRGRDPRARSRRGRGRGGGAGAARVRRAADPGVARSGAGASSRPAHVHPLAGGLLRGSLGRSAARGVARRRRSAEARSARRAGAGARRPDRGRSAGPDSAAPAIRPVPPPHPYAGASGGGGPDRVADRRRRLPHPPPPRGHRQRQDRGLSEGGAGRPPHRR